ncbi:DNA helicase [Trifolium repens]|nr:DNA helicase [Trifolium repens]
MMSTILSTIFQGRQQGWFTTVHVPCQNFAEIDPFFVAQHKEDLESDWEIYDAKGLVGNVKFNGSVLKPLLTTGWQTLTSHYSWIGNQKLCFFYYGGNKFIMFIYHQTCYVTPTEFPYFHTMCTSVGSYPSFYISIHPQDITSPFKTLCSEAKVFLNPTNHLQVKLCGPLENVVTVELIRDPNTDSVLKFGEGWTTFCALNQIVNGNLLHFKLEDRIDNSNVLLVKIV